MRISKAQTRQDDINQRLELAEKELAALVNKVTAKSELLGKVDMQVADIQAQKLSQRDAEATFRDLEDRMFKMRERQRQIKD